MVADTLTTAAAIPKVGGTAKHITETGVTIADTNNNISTPGSLTTGAGGSIAGYHQLGQGTAPSAGTTAVTIAAPAAVTSYVRVLPGSANTGFYLGTNSAGTVTDTQVGSTGTGNVVLATNPTFSTSASLGTGYLSTTQVAGSTGTTANLLTTFDTSAQMVVPATSAVGVLGIAASTQTTGQNVEVATRGVINCVADNSTTVGNLLGVGTTTAGRCKDLGQTDSTAVPLGIQIIGKARTAVSAASNVSVQLYGPGHYGAQVTESILPSSAKQRSIGCAVGDPSGSALSTGVLCYVVSPVACTINAWDLLVDAGTATVASWKVATGTAIPTVSNTISTSGVAISTGTAVHSATVTDFTSTAIAANDIIAFNLTAVATAKYIYFAVQCTR